MITWNEKQNLVDVLRRNYTMNELAHAWRFNGIVDIYKNGQCVYNKKENKYDKPNTISEMEIHVLSILNKYPAEVFHVSLRKGKTKPTYQDLVKRIIPAVHEQITTIKPEDYHWQLNKERSNDDMYFLFHNGFVKIGRSRDMDRRIRQLKTSLSSDYECYLFFGKGYLETKFHSIFKEYRQHGEWFTEHQRMREFVNKRILDGTSIVFKESTSKAPKKISKREPLAVESKMPFGKYKGVIIQDIFKNDFGYMLWLENNLPRFSNTFDESVKKLMMRHSRKEQLKHN